MHDTEDAQARAQLKGQFLSAFDAEVHPLILEHRDILREARVRLMDPQPDHYAVDGIEYALEKSWKRLRQAGLEEDDIDKIVDFA